MRIAVISDIHANIFSFKLAIDDLKKQAIDKIIYLGDYVTDGDANNEVLQIVRDTAFYAILGNRDEYILNYDSLKKDFMNYKTIATTYNSLSEDNITYLETLKPVEMFEVNKKRILMIHGHEYIDYNIDLYDTYDKIMTDYEFDICLFVHSHIYSYDNYKNKIFINPGSIGVPTDGASYKYCILDFKDDMKVELREFKVSDTFIDFKKYYMGTNFYKDNKIWGNLILKTIESGTDYCALFVNKVNDEIDKIENIDLVKYNEIFVKVYNLYFKEGIDY